MQTLKDSKTSEEAVEGVLENWDKEVHCQSRTHKTDSWNHAPNEPATVRGYAPCGETMNICEKFSRIIIKGAPRGGSLLCKCGAIHEAKLFRFVNI